MLKFPFVPEEAEFKPTTGGWAYSREGRFYKLGLEQSPGAAVRGLLEVWMGRLYAVRWADWSLAIERHELAKLLAEGDEGLEREIRRDLQALRMAVTFAKIEGGKPT
jgi:hypothetical protein